jgi:hypothetical protein
LKQKTNGLEPFGVGEEKKIIRDCVKATKTIETLAGRAYRVLSLSSGFIAHYNKWGFKNCCREPGSLKRDILNRQNHNRWEGFRPGLNADKTKEFDFGR